MSTSSQTSFFSAPIHKFNLFHTVCMALLAFISVMLLHQLLVGGISYGLGYQTQITFGQVVSQPFANKFWSSNRVLLMYAMPSVLFLLLATALAVYLLVAVRQINNRYRYFFWVMVFCVLLISTQFSLAPLAATVSKGSIYTGIAVVANWWGITANTLWLATAAALFINMVFGFIAFRLLMQLSPSRSAVQNKSGQAHIIISYFILPLVIVFPFALLLGYPHSLLFFTAMLFHAFFWLPGLFIKTENGYRFTGVAATTKQQDMGNWVPVLLLLLVVIIKLLL